MTRSKPLQRSHWGIKRKRARRVARKSEGEKAFTAWIHTQPCVGRFHLEGHICLNRAGVRTHEVEQSHERNMTGLGLKANDTRSVAMCGWLARQWDEHAGWFGNWSKEERRHWMAERIIEAHANFQRDTGKAAA